MVVLLPTLAPALDAMQCDASSSAPFRYDPNDLSMGDDDDSGSQRSAIKNLNFSKIAREGDSDLGSGSASLSRDSGSGIATSTGSTTTRNGSASAFSPDWMREAAAASGGEGDMQGESEGPGTSSGSSGISC